jgi:putative transposase
MSVWELKEILRALKEKGLSEVNESIIFEALGRMRALVEDSVAKSKAARRLATRKPKTNPLRDGAHASGRAIDDDGDLAAPHVPPTYGNPFNDDPFAEPIQPFDDLAVSR